eukprot:2046618-Rhodomonas_salina.1
MPCAVLIWAMLLRRSQGFCPLPRTLWTSVGYRDREGGRRAVWGTELGGEERTELERGGAGE